MPLDDVDADVQAELGAHIDDRTHVGHRLGADECAVRLQQRPEREDAQVIEAEFGQAREVAAHVIEVQ